MAVLPTRLASLAGGSIRRAAEEDANGEEPTKQQGNTIFVFALQRCAMWFPSHFVWSEMMSFP